jgi:hypothetical protein
MLSKAELPKFRKSAGPIEGSGSGEWKLNVEIEVLD